ncbi:MAG: C10 family peptidase, partial [Bacteroidales bacterium]
MKIKIEKFDLQQFIIVWRSLFFLLIFFSMIHNVFPREIEKDKLVEYGEKAFQQKCQASFGNSFQKMNLEKVHFVEENNQLLLAILDYQDQGFIVLSADDAMMPVLAYSVENGLNMDDLAPAVRYWLDIYKLQVQEVRKNKIEPTDEVVQAWKKLKSPLINKGTVVVAPLISAQWNQSKYYNQYSPFDQNSPEGYDGRVPVGCVAVAMSMIMYYYRYPETGIGSKTNYTNYGDFYVNFGATEYHYEAMLDDLTTYNSEVAKLIFHAATSVDMNYAADGSGAYSVNVPDALATHFNYSQNIQQILRSHSSNADWISMLKTELNNRRPVYYSGSSEEGGHAFVCDGYDSDDLFHFNFGWGGTGNGYFSVNNTVSDAVGGYNNYQGIVKGIYPGGIYPNYCSEHEIIKATSGSLDDGSGNQNYLNNTNCTYVIAPDNAQSFTITIQTINTEENVDTLSFWKGNPENGLLVSSYSGTSNSPQTLTIENTDSLYITFKTNNTVTGEGWKLKYSVERDVTACSSLLVFTQPSGTFEDGSGDAHYASSSEC